MKAANPNDEKYAHLAMALSNRDDGMDTFGNTGQLRIPTHSSFGLGNRGTNVNDGAANPFQNLGGAGASNNSNSLIDIGDSGSNLGRSNSNNPFQAIAQAGGQTNSGFLSSQATGYGGMNSNGFGQNGHMNNNSGAYSNNMLF